MAASTAAGMLFLTILGSFAEFERARTSERMLETYARRKKHGRPVGRAPYGFRLAGRFGQRRFVPDPKTREVGAKIVEWIDRGWSADAVYFHLLETRQRTAKGKEWSRGAIQRAYRGEVQLRRREAAEAAKKKTVLTPDSPDTTVSPGQSDPSQPGGGES
jgi:site-specific DNA recombinase